MTWLANIRYSLRVLFRRQRADQELSDEVQSHLDMQVAANIAAGMKPAEARYAALRAFGGVDQVAEQCRDARGLEFVGTLLQDLRYGVRLMFKNPGFTVVALLSLGLGIGANAAIFSVINSVLLRPLPFKEPERLVTIWHHHDKVNLPRVTISPRTFTVFRDENHSFEQVAALREWNVILTDPSNPEPLEGMRVSEGFFLILGVQPAMGRVFLPEEDEPGRSSVVVLSDAFWRSHFGSDQSIIGKSISLDGSLYTVVGVMPPRFAFPREVELWSPMAFTAEQLTSFTENLAAVARLRNGVSIEQAQADMAILEDRIREMYPNSFNSTGWGANAIPLNDVLVGNIRLALLVLLAAVAFVLLIACANVASLLLARATVRQKEIAIRTAVGARRSRLVRQLLTESLLLGLVSGGLGLLIASWGVAFILKMTPGDLSLFLPNWDTVGVDRWVLIFTFSISVLTALIFGLAPALRASRTDLNEALKEGGRNAVGGGRNRVRSVLVATEIALAMVLLVGAGLLLRSFLHLQQVNPGFRTNNVLTMRVSLPTSQYDDGQIASFYPRLLQEVSAIPGVESAGVVSSLPLTLSNTSSSFLIEGMPVGPGEAEPHGTFHVVSPDYFAVLGIPLLRGRLFSNQEFVEGAPVAIIDEVAARRYWPNDDPIGERLFYGFERTQDEPLLREIIGVVGHVQHSGLDVESRLQVYLPSLHNARFARAIAGQMFLVIRTASAPETLVSVVRMAVGKIDPNVPIHAVRSMDQVLSDSVAQRRLSMLLLALFAGIALILTLIGIYGVISYWAAQRRHEVGIRMALGARRGEIFKLILGHGLTLALVGVGIGLAASLALSQLLAGLLYGVPATDPLTYAMVAFLLIAVAVLASFVPARQAMRVDPIQALRSE